MAASSASATAFSFDGSAHGTEDGGSVSDGDTGTAGDPEGVTGYGGASMSGLGNGRSRGGSTEVLLRRTRSAPAHERRWKHWPGNNVFLCGGRVMLGPNWCALLTTNILKTTALVLLLLFVLQRPLSPGSSSLFDDDACQAFAAALTTLYALCLVLGLCTAATEPGIISRMPNSVVVKPPSPKAGTRDDLLGARDPQYCEVCNIYQPPRARHCKKCDNCVNVYDHHCFWLGTCIGARNYSYFMLYLLCLLGYAAMGMVLCILRLISFAEGDMHGQHGTPTFGEFVEHELATLLTIGLIFPALIGVGGLVLMHCCCLIRTNRTTYEYMVRAYDYARNPYDRGAASNCLIGFCYRRGGDSQLPDMTERTPDYHSGVTLRGKYMTL